MEHIHSYVGIYSLLLIYVGHSKNLSNGFITGLSVRSASGPGMFTAGGISRAAGSSDRGTYKVQTVGLYTFSSSSSRHHRWLNYGPSRNLSYTTAICFREILESALGFKACSKGYLEIL